MRIYAQVERMPHRAAELTAKADRLIGKNVKPPMPLFDRIYDGRGHGRKSDNAGIHPHDRGDR